MARETPNNTGERTVQIRRCSCVVKGGRRFSFAAMVVTGDEQGKCGYGYGKGTEVPLAIDKAVKAANRTQMPIPMVGTTIPHEVQGRFGASKVSLFPASPGTGIIAGGTVRAVVEAAGIRDILTKSRGSANPVNLVKATFDALRQLRQREDVERLRGVSLPQV